MATLTVSLTEELELNGKKRGGEHTFSIGSITQAYTRVVTCPANNDTTVATFQTAVHTADNAIDLEDCKYIRVTNLDSTNEVVLSLQSPTTRTELQTGAPVSYWLQVRAT